MKKTPAPQPLDLLAESRIFARYLINNDVSLGIQKRYSESIDTSVTINRADQKILGYVAKHPFTLGIVDAGLPFYNPDSELRRRLYVLLAILEASPEYADVFIPKKRSLFYLLFIGFSGLRAIASAAAGAIFVRMVVAL